MKKTILITLAAMGSAFGAFGQGAVGLDNSTAAEGIVLTGTTGGSASGLGFYSGTAGVEVWYKNGSAYDVSSLNGLFANPAAAYAKLTADGFTLATTFIGANVSGGGFGLGDLHIAGVSPAGSPITLAIASWQGSGATFQGAANGGVLGFIQPTADYTIAPTPTSPDLTAATGGFNTTDLRLNAITAVPEPSSFALAGLGAAAMLIFRRRK